MFENLFSRSGLSFDRLNNFLKVAKVESFTRAAEGDPNRQTLYSRQVKDLEQFFHTELFHRKGRTVTLTQNGKQLYSLLCEYFNALEDYSELVSGDLGEYVIGAGDSIIQWSLLPLLASLHECFGHAELTFKNLRTRDIIEGIERGDLNFGVVRSNSVTSKLSSLKIGSFKFAAFIPIEAKIENEKEETILSQFSFAGMEGDGIYQETMTQLAAKHGTIIKCSVKCSSFPMMAKAVRTHGIAAILPEIASEELPAEKFKKLILPSLRILDSNLDLCWSRRLEKVNSE